MRGAKKSVFFFMVCAAWTGSAGSEDPAAREVQRNQQLRQQQQDELQLRMQQHQRGSQDPRGSRREAIHRLEIEQQQRQRELHYRQGASPPPPVADDDAAARARSQIERGRTEEAGRAQLRRFDWEHEQALKRGARQ